MPRRKIHFRRDIALRKPAPKTWLPVPGKRVYLPYRKQILYVPTGWIYQVRKYDAAVFYISHAPFTDQWLRACYVDLNLLRPAPQMTTPEEQLTILEDMISLSQTPSVLRAIRSGGSDKLAT